MEEKLVAFKKLAEESVNDFWEISEVYLVKSTVNDDWGLLKVDISDSQTNLESHCQQCYEDSYPFRFGPTKDFPYKNISILVSPKKMKDILDGAIKLPSTIALAELLAAK